MNFLTGLYGAEESYPIYIENYQITVDNLRYEIGVLEQDAARALFQEDQAGVLHAKRQLKVLRKRLHVTIRDLKAYRDAYKEYARVEREDRQAYAEDERRRRVREYHHEQIRLRQQGLPLETYFENNIYNALEVEIAEEAYEIQSISLFPAIRTLRNAIRKLKWPRIKFDNTRVSEKVAFEMLTFKRIVQPVTVTRDEGLVCKLRDVINIMSLNRKPIKLKLEWFDSFANFNFGTRDWRRPIDYTESIRLLEYIESLIYATTEQVEEGNSEAVITSVDPPDLDFDVMPEDDSKVIFKGDEIIFSKCKRCSCPRIEAEMEEAHGDCDDLNIEQKENVILTTHADESKAEPVSVDTGIWEKMCSPQNIKEYTQLMSRWQRFQTVKWTRDMARGSTLANYNLPIDFIKANRDSPNCILFNQYAFARFDLEIKIVVNSNKFHCGALQGSYYYGANLDQHYKDRQNIYSASQISHCIIDAAASSDGILKIPYRYYKPLMATTSRADDQDVLNMGLFRLLVLNQLKTPNNDNNNVEVSVFIRFVNPSFHGMKPRDLGKVEGEMLGMANLVKETANLVQQVFPDAQRDNPTDVIPPKPMVPWSAHSWCIGDVSPEPTNVLRMQSTGNTPHPPGTLPDEPEMSIDYITSIYGLFKQISWSTDQAVGTVLAKIPFSPVLFEYPQVTLNNGAVRVCDIMPPISVMAQFFAYWRGGIDYRLDFIATMFHTGRLIIAYLPRVIAESNPTLDQLTYCDHIIVDLRDERQVQYINSFLSDKPWYPRRSSNAHSTEFYPPGYIYIAVLNPLTATATVTDNIDINMYMRAAKDFEMHIPVSPDIGLSYNTVVDSKDSGSISYLPTYGPPYTPIYVDTWHTIGDQSLTLRWGIESDRIVQFRKEDLNRKIKVLELKEPANVKIKHPNFKLNLKYLVLYCTDTSKSYVYGAPFDNYLAANAFAESLKDSVLQPDSYKLFSQSGNKSGGEWVQTQSTLHWYDSISGFEIVGEVGEERTQACGSTIQIQNTVASTWNGLLTFGEQITSVKPLLRRYMPYALMKIDKQGVSDSAMADFAFPVMPQGLDLVLKDENGKEFKYGNRIRDGPIPIIASGYRFFRGAIRLRLIFLCAIECVVWIQHRPEYSLRSVSVMKPDGKYKESYYQPGYGYMVQLTKMNNVVEIEVPFYLPGQFGLLQRPDLTKIEDAVHYSLGMLYIGMNGVTSMNIDKPIVVEVMYSMGDDMSFTVFQGFPPMIDLSIFNKPAQQVIQAEGPMDYLKNKIKGAMIDEVKKDLSKGLEEVMATDDNSNFISILEQYIPELTAEKKLVIASCLGNIIHCAINPSLATIAWSIANILCNMGLIAMAFVERMCSVLKKFLSSLPNLLSREKKQDSSPRVEAEAEDEDTKVEAAFVSTCVAGMLALGGATRRELPKNLPNFASFLYAGMPKFTLTANGLCVFLKNNLEMFKRIWYWIISKFNKDYILYTELGQAPDAAIQFVKKIQWCVDARNLKAVRADIKATTQVYELANIAQSYMAKRAVSTVSKPMPLFDMYCKKIIALRDDLTRDMLSPAIRFEPYVISFNGPSNVGKSHLAQFVSRELLKSIDYKTYDELVYTRTPGNAYWNGLKNQPVCLFDDFLNIEDTTHSLVSLGELYCLKSKAVFNPPMAAVEEKKLRYNPLLVLLCNNKAFPKINGLGLEEAWMRRRDLLIETRKLPEYKGKHPRSLPKEIKDGYKHLQFSFYKDPAGTDAASRETDGVWLKFDEMLPKLVEKFQEHFHEECEQYHEALDQIKAFYPSDDESTEEFTTRMRENIVAINNDPKRIPPQELNKTVQILLELKNNEYIADMTKYVKTQIIKKKVEEFKKEDPPKTTPVVKAEADDTITYIPAEIRSEDLDINKYDEFVKKSESLYNCCDCSLYWGMGMNLVMQGDKLVCECDLSKLIKPARRHTYSNVIKTFDFKPCSTDCFMNDALLAKKLWMCNSVKSVAEDRLPKFLIALKPKVSFDELTPQTIEYITPDEIDAQIKEEVADLKWYEKLWSNIPTWGTILKWIIKLGTVLAALGAMIRLGGYFYCSPKKAANDVQIQECNKSYLKLSKDIIQAKQSVFDHINKTKIQPMLKESASEESGSYKLGTIGAKAHSASPIKAIRGEASEAMENVIVNKIRRNSFLLVIETGEPNCRVLRKFRCLGLVKNYFLYLDHYLLSILHDTNPIAYFCQANMYVRISLDIFKAPEGFKESAFLIGKMDKTVPQFCNIIKFFIRSAATGNISPHAKLYETCKIDDKDEYCMKVYDCGRIDRRERTSVNNNDNSVTVVSHTFVYPYSGKGMCGSVLVSNDNIPYPILGIHVAGLSGSSEGYAESVVYETFKKFVDDPEPKIVENSSCPYPITQEKPIMELDGNVEIIGSISRKLACYPPDKSRLMHSEVAGLITPVTYDKPVLSSKDPRIADNPFSPLLEGCKHHTNPCLPMESIYVDRAIEDVKNMLLAHVKPQRINIGRLTVEQAVCGIFNNDKYEAMNMQTSEGFPWIHERPAGASDKTWMFDRELTPQGWKLHGIYHKLKHTLKERELLRRQGEFIDTIFVDCLKDSKLPKEKVLLPGKTRVFSISPVDFTIQQRQFTNDFVVAYTAARVKTEHAVGIDIYGLETNKLVEYMMEYGNNMVCGDYSKFGDQLNAKIILAVYDIIVDWYKFYGNIDDEFANVIKCFGRETCNAVHLMLNLLYRSCGGMPSGNPLTVVINSIVNSVYVRVVWQQIMFRNAKLRFMDMLSFNRNVRVITYGDDLWLSVKSEFVDMYNAQSMHEAFKLYGIKFTNSTKGDTIIPFTGIHDKDTTFLKCTFHKHERRANIWMAKMERRVVEETCNWIWNKNRDVRASSIEACHAMLELAYGHGEEYYMTLRQQVIEFWRSRGVMFSSPDWHSIDMRIYE